MIYIRGSADRWPKSVMRHFYNSGLGQDLAFFFFFLPPWIQMICSQKDTNWCSSSLLVVVEKQPASEGWMADWAQWSLLRPRKMRLATIIQCYLWRGGGLWCDSLTNSLWQDPRSHKDCTVALYLCCDEQIRDVCVCVRACGPLIIHWSVTEHTCLTVLQSVTQTTPGCSTVTSIYCWGLFTDCIISMCVCVVGGNYSACILQERSCHPFIFKDRVCSSRMQSF